MLSDRAKWCLMTLFWLLMLGVQVWLNAMIGNNELLMFIVGDCVLVAMSATCAYTNQRWVFRER